MKEEFQQKLIEKDNVILKFQVTLTQERIILGLLGVSLIGISIYAWKAHRKRVKAEQRAQELLGMDNAWECVVCMNKEKQIVYLPCNHLR